MSPLFFLYFFVILLTLRVLGDWWINLSFFVLFNPLQETSFSNWHLSLCHDSVTSSFRHKTISSFTFFDNIRFFKTWILLIFTLFHFNNFISHAAPFRIKHRTQSLQLTQASQSRCNDQGTTSPEQEPRSPPFVSFLRTKNAWELVAWSANRRIHKDPAVSKVFLSTGSYSQRVTMHFRTICT